MNRECVGLTRGGVTRVVRKGLTYIAATIITAFMVFPLVWMLFLSFKTNDEIFNNTFALPSRIDLGIYVTAFIQGRIASLFANSMIITGSSTLLQLVICLLSSFALARLRFRSQTLKFNIYIFFILGLAIPLYIILLPLYRILLSLRLIDTYWSLILPYAIYGFPFGTLFLVESLKGFSADIENAALIDGCNVVQMIFRIVLPIIQPVIVTLFIFYFIGGWNEFPVAAVVINKASLFTIPLASFYFTDRYGTNFQLLSASVIIIVIPQIIFYLFFQKKIMAGVMAGALKG
jgi:raffinose/stachyose/melibiose transport system permease protein